MKEKIEVVIVEDQADVAGYLSTLVAETPEFHLRGGFTSAEDALQARLPKNTIDVFLVDLGLPGLSGVQFITQAKKHYPMANFLVHTISENGDQLWAALAAGAVGYVLKGSSDAEIVAAIETVAEGNAIISQRMAFKLTRFFKTIAEPAAVLTNREKDILAMLQANLTYERIGESLFISTHTVHTHIKNIYKKLNVKNRTDAVATACAYGILDAGNR